MQKLCNTGLEFLLIVALVKQKLTYLIYRYLSFMCYLFPKAAL